MGGKGVRHRTRHVFKKDFKKKGRPHLSTYLRVFKLGEYVTIHVDPSIQQVKPLLSSAKNPSGNASQILSWQNGTCLGRDQAFLGRRDQQKSKKSERCVLMEMLGSWSNLS